MQLVMEMDGTEGKYVGWVGVPDEMIILMLVSLLIESLVMLLDGSYS